MRVIPGLSVTQVLRRYPVTAAALAGLALTLALAGAVQAATRFVATTGSDAGPNDCLSSGSPCKTITHALTEAAANDTIQVAAGTYDNTVNGETFPLTITQNQTITGAGAGSTIIDAEMTNRVMSVTGVTVSLSAVMITGGKATGVSAFGGGILNSGALTLTNVTVSGNTATATAGGIQVLGGGILNNSTLTLTNVTVSGNTATATANGGIAAGGGIFNRGTATLTNVTVSGNTATATGTSTRASGGGIGSTGTATLTNVTVSGNTATATGTGAQAAGGGICRGGGKLILLNTIAALNPSGGDCFGTITSSGHNLDSDGTCGLSSTGDLSNVTNPLLGPLALNSPGTTQTHALLLGSPAIDGVLSGCPPPATDQRGVSRPEGPHCDIGAYEFVLVGVPILSEWAQLGMAIVLVGGGLLALRRRSRAGLFP